MDYEACDKIWLEEQAILRGQALYEAWETEFALECALIALKSQALRWDKVLQKCTDYDDLPVPLQAEVYIPNFVLEIGKAQDGSWFWIAWIRTPYPWKSDEGFASADEALQAALEAVE